MKSLVTNPTFRALAGLSSILPFLIINTIVMNRVEPFISILRPDNHTNIFEQILLFFLLLVLPLAGAYIAARPALQKGPDGKRPLYVVNIIITLLLITGAVIFSSALLGEIYQCDILKIPNCD